MALQFRNTTVVVFFSLLVSCGLFEPGVSQILDPIPVGMTVAYQGSFQTTQGISGTALIYTAAGKSDVIRLEGFVAPSTAYVIRGVVGGTEKTFATLKAARGNQNYDSGESMHPVWTSIRIAKSGAQADTFDSQALLSIP